MWIVVDGAGQQVAGPFDNQEVAGAALTEMRAGDPAAFADHLVQEAPLADEEAHADRELIDEERRHEEHGDDHHHR